MFDVIIPANGRSERMGFDKLSENISSATVLQRAVNAFMLPEVDNIIVVCDNPPPLTGAMVVRGGNTRAESVKCGLSHVKSEYVLIHDGARPFVSRELIRRVMESTKEYGSGIPVIPSSDSIRKIEGDRIIDSLNRADYVLVQTPQGFGTDLIKRAFEMEGKAGSATDESEIYLRQIAPCHVVAGDVYNRKMTTPADFFGVNAKIGAGFDLHRFTKGKKLRLCGVEIEYEMGLLAHSDGDVALHAIMDAVLTSIGMRDIGVQFPDDDIKYRNADSRDLLKTVMGYLKNAGAEIVSLNLTIIAQKPKLADHIEPMRRNLSILLQCPLERISISATTTEKMGVIGNGEAMACLATVAVI